MAITLPPIELPILNEKDLGDGRIEFSGLDPRLGRGPSGSISGLNFLHDTLLAQNPSWGDARFEGGGEGQFSIVIPRAYRAGLMTAIKDTMNSPVVGRGYSPQKVAYEKTRPTNAAYPPTSPGSSRRSSPRPPAPSTPPSRSSSAAPGTPPGSRCPPSRSSARARGGRAWAAPTATTSRSTAPT